MADPNPYNNFRSGIGSSGRNQQQNLDLFFDDLKTLGIETKDAEKTPEIALNIVKGMPDISKLYKKLALKFHPDKNLGDPSAEVNFKNLTGANDNLKKLKDSDEDLKSCEINLALMIKERNEPTPPPAPKPQKPQPTEPKPQPQPPTPPPGPQRQPQPQTPQPAGSDIKYQSFLNDNKEELDNFFAFFKKDYDLVYNPGITSSDKKVNEQFGDFVAFKYPPSKPTQSQIENDTKLRQEFDKRVKEFVTTPLKINQADYTWEPKNSNDPLDFSFNIISTSASNGGNLLRTERAKFFAENPTPEQSSQINTQKEKEQSIQGRWSSFAQSLTKLKKDIDLQVKDASSKIDSTVKSASSDVRDFGANLAESTKNRVDSLAMTISTSAKTTFTQASSTAMSWIVSIKLPEIKINLPSTETNQENTKTPHESQKQEPKTTYTEKTLGKRIREELELRREQQERVEKAIETAKAASSRAKEAAQKAPPPTAPIRRTGSATAPSNRTQAKPADPTPPTKRTNSAPLQKPEPRDPRVAFFGPRAEKHGAYRDQKRHGPESPTANGPSKANASLLSPPKLPHKT